jgi:hypothetical protein
MENPGKGHNDPSGLVFWGSRVPLALIDHTDGGVTAARLEADGNIGNSCPGPRPILDWVHLESTDTQTDHARVERRSRLFTRSGHAAACSGYTSITYSSSVENFGDMSSGPEYTANRCQ